MQKELFSLLGGLFSAVSSGKRGAVENRSVAIGSESYNYQIYTPPDVRNETKLPVIIFLHGIRERGTTGFVPTAGAIGNLLLHYFARVPAIILLPQCRPEKYWSNPEMDEMVMKSLAQTVAEFSADDGRIYLTGVSMGGYGVWHFASKYPEKFAALVSICGGSSIMSGDRFAPIAEKVGKTPAWLFHGADDKVVPVSESREMTKALENNKGNVKYTEYEGAGHNVWLNVVSEKELLSWLLAQHLD